MHLQDIYVKWTKRATYDPEITQELNRISGDDKAIGERFYSELKFGTGGLRGIIGAGTNRMNVYTVAKATNGLSRYLKEYKKFPSVVIAFDTRKNSSFFARSAAEVLAQNGISVYIFDEVTPTPVLSFAVRYLSADAGIVITASHNPAEYNGYKVYGSDGCQITLEAAKRITGHIKTVDALDNFSFGDFQKYQKQGMIRFVSGRVLDAYYEEVLRRGVKIHKTDLKVVYTPLNGTGNKPVRHILRRIGIQQVDVVPEQEEPDSNFSTCPYPNPEEKEALSLAVKLAEDCKADIVLATDPDCDRVGTAVWADGKYLLLSGNQMGILLLDFLCRMRLEMGNMPEHPVAIKTIVTTEMAREIASEYGVALIDVLTGFKFIGEQIGFLEEKGEEDRFVFGFEESYGYLAGSYVRDKDAVQASMLICQMTAYYKKCEKTLLDVLNELYSRHGYYFEKLESYGFAGMDGMKNMQSIMEKLRKTPPAELGELRVVHARDYMLPEQGRTEEQGVFLPSANVVSFVLQGGSKVTVRPSGTEPKLKIYYSIKCKDKPTAEIQCEKICKDMEGIVLK
jgi:phosphoglucomutase